ncbi:MAG: pilus assembly protein TadG-related protein [Marmoricola sp.]
MRRRREQGAVAIFLALTVCFVMVPLGALAVDIGTQRVARRDAQAVADTVALDMARVLGSGTTPTDALAQARANTMPGAVGGPTVHVYTGYLAGGATFLSNQSLGCGSTTTNAYFTSVPAGKSANAVLVTATGSVSFSLHGGSGGVCRSSIAGIRATACFKLGSYAARISSGDSTLLSMLNNVLGGSFGLNLGLVDYQGLAATKVSLADLAADPHIGTVDALLTGGVTYNNLALAALDVVSRTDPGSTVAIAALKKMVQASGSVAGTVKLGDSVIDVSPSDAAALETKLNVLDLLTGTVLAASGGYAIDADRLQVQVPGLGNVASSTLKIIQAAQIACGYPGEATAEASQLTGDIVIPALQAASINLPGPGPTLKTQTASADLSLHLGRAKGVLADPIVCGAGTTASPHKIPVDVTADAADLTLGAVIPATLDTSLTIGVASLYTIHFDYKFVLSLSTSVAASSTSTTLTIPPNDVTPVTTGSALSLSTDPAQISLAADPSATTVQISLLGGTIFSGTLKAALDPVNGLLSSLISGVSSTTTAAASSLLTKVKPAIATLIGNLNQVLAPFSPALGLTVGGADVFAVKSPVCNSPVLKG